MRVVHYVNQFFGGIGGEEKADLPPEVRSGAIGPGRLLEQVLGEDSQVVVTVICGDNYASESLQDVIAAAVKEVRNAKADLLVAGPCFQAGRYGVAAGAVCAGVQDELGIPAITAMSPENPGVDLYRETVYIVDSGENVAQMKEVLSKMAVLGNRLTTGEPLGLPSAQGYFPQGILRSQFVEKTAARRLTDMLMAKLKSEPFQPEVPIRATEPTPIPPPVPDLSKATIALVTDGGLVPKGNPDHIPRGFAMVWGAYSIAGKDALAAEEYEVSHGGYDNRQVQSDPHRLVPLDVMRQMEYDGVVGRLHPEFLSTTGNVNPLENSRRMGREMAERLNGVGVNAVILTSTGGTSTRSGAAIATELEKAGIPVAQITAMIPVAKSVGSNRIIRGRGIVNLLGDAGLSTQEELELRRDIVRQALDALATEGGTAP